MNLESLGETSRGEVLGVLVSEECMQWMNDAQDMNVVQVRLADNERLPIVGGKLWK